jgi:NitT/TauT family transport system substrate-binding protein
MSHLVRRIALTVLVAFGVTAGVAACAPAPVTPDSTELSTSLEPVPFAEPVNITMSMVAKLEHFTPALLAIAEGEFEKENMTVDVEILPFTESIPALAQGIVDVAVSGITAPFFNAIDGGAEIKSVMPGAASSSADGLYVRADLAAQGPAALKGKKIGSSVGVASTPMIPIMNFLAEGGLTLDDVTIEVIPLVDLPAALLAGQVDAAWVNSPTHLSLTADNAAVKVTQFDDSVYVSGVFFGPNLLEENPAIGQAVVRALTRTTLTYLQGDYKSDPVIVQKIADALEVTVEDVLITDSIVFGSEFRTDFFTVAQEFWISVGDILNYDTVILPEDYVDSSFYDRIVRD